MPTLIIHGDDDQIVPIARPTGLFADFSMIGGTAPIRTARATRDVRRASAARRGDFSAVRFIFTSMCHGGIRLRSVAQRMADSLTHTPLTSREIEVLSLVVAGECNKAIARALRIGLNTVKSHMTAIMAKLGATSRTQAAGIAATRGLVEERASMRRMTAPMSSASRHRQAYQASEKFH